MCEPIHSGRSGSEDILQSAVEPLHEAVRLRVLDGEEGTNEDVNCGPPVACDGVWHAEQLDLSLRS